MIQKKQLKVDRKPNIRAEIMKIRIKRFYDLKFLDGFLDMAQKEQMMEAKIDKLDFINIKNFCVAKDMIKKLKKTTSRLGGDICRSYV